MDIIVGKIWLLVFSLLVLMPILYCLIKVENIAFNVRVVAIVAALCNIVFDIVVTAASYYQQTLINIYVLMLLWQLSLLFSAVTAFYLVLNELKEKYLRYDMRNDWVYIVPSIFEAALIVFFNLSSYAAADVILIDMATSISLYFIINFYILVGAWLCYKGYLYNLDFDIKYIARKHFYFFLVMCVVLFCQQILFNTIDFGIVVTIFLVYNYMTRSRTLISKDALSGVNNRVSFNKYINNAFINHDHGPAYIVFFDIDKFKAINDTYGHLEGDEAIALVGKTLKSVAGETNSFVARMGGDEFVLVVNTESEERVREIIQTITYELEERLIFSDKQYEITVSSGIVRVEPNARNIKELISKADKLMYLEKQSKRTGAVNGNY